MLGHCSCHSGEELSVGVHAGCVGAAGCLLAVAAAAAVSVSACATAPMAATAAAAAFGSSHSYYISSVVPEVVWWRELPHIRGRHLPPPIPARMNGWQAAVQSCSGFQPKGRAVMAAFA